MSPESTSESGLPPVASIPMVSVAMPVYNGASYIAAAIESVLAQTLQDLEIVIVDDASTDDSAHVISQFQDSRIRFHRNDKNLGMTGNWNRSVSLTRGRYVTMLHQDDEMLPENLDRKMKALASGEFRWVASDCYQIGAGGETLHEHWFQHQAACAVAGRSRRAQFAKMFFGANYLCFPTIMWERRLMEESGRFTDDAAYCADVHMWLRMLSRARLCYLPERLLRYRWAQNLSLQYDEDRWHVDDLLARLAVARDLRLGPMYSLGLRVVYGLRFGRRAIGHWFRGQHEKAHVTLESLRALIR